MSEEERLRLEGGIDFSPPEGLLERLGISIRRATEVHEDEFVYCPRGTWFVYHHEQKVWHQFCRPDRVERAIGHVQDGYGWRGMRSPGEIQYFLELQAMLQGAQGEVRHFRSLSKEERRAFTARCLEVSEELATARMEEKLAISWRVGSAAEGRDSLGRANPNASENKLAWAGKDAVKLVRAMRGICDKVERRALTTRFEITAREGEARLFHSFLTEVLRLLPRREMQIHALIMLRGVMKDMAKVHDKPWMNLYRRSIRDDLEPAKKMIVAGKYEEAVRYIDRVLFVLEALELEREFVEIFYDISLLASKQPRLEEKRKEWLRRLDLERTKLEYFTRSIPEEVTRRGVRWRVDRYLRGTTLANFLTNCKAAVISLNCVHASPDFARTHIRNALIRLRQAEKCW